MSSETILLLTPEIILVAAATLIFVIGAFFPLRRAWTCLGLVAIAAAGCFLIQQTVTADFHGPLLNDSIGQFVRWLSLGLGALFLLMTSRPASKEQAAEVCGSLLLAIAGVMIVSVSGELVLLFLGLELISIPTYVLLYLGRNDAASQEATTKYFFLSVLSSAVLLYGFSFLYGVSGTTWLGEMAEHLSQSELSAGLRPLALLALVFVFAGLGFKIAAVPFHFYAPDVYQGTTHANAAVLSVLPKLAGLVALMRIVPLALPSLQADFVWRLALILAVLTMTLGNVVALWQDNLRRLLAYSSIAHAGYLMIGIAIAFAIGAESNDPVNRAGIEATLFYLGLYAVATTGAFAALSWLGSHETDVNKVDDLAGLGRSHPFTAVALAVFLFSLAGIPPLAGFWGKLSLFSAAISVDAGAGAISSLRVWFLVLAVLGVLNAAVAAAYYLRIIAAMYFRPQVSTPPAEGGAGAWTAMFASVLLVAMFGFYPASLARYSHLAARDGRFDSRPAKTPNEGAPAETPAVSATAQR